MQDRSKAALILLIAAALFGFLADQLLKVTPWGINVMLATLVLAGVVYAVSRATGTPLVGGGRWFVLPALVFAGLFALRDTTALALFNLLALLCCLAVLAARGATGRVVVAGIGGYIKSLLVAGVSALIGVLPLVLIVRWRELNLTGNARAISRVLVGLAIAAPLLLIFGALFVAADAGFEQLLRDLFDIDIDQLIMRAFFTGLLAWLAAGALWQMLLNARDQSAPPVGAGEQRRLLSLGIVEMGVVLGLLNVLFAAFVATQARYFFGGAALVLDTADASNRLTFAEYARRGFFELVTVAALVLVVLLIANWITRQDDARHARVFRLLAGTLIALLFVIMASALHRMWTYTRVYGLTELRVYTTVFMLWLALVFIWFIASTLRGHGDRFAFGMVLSGLAALLVLNLINPLDLIARTNVARIVETGATAAAPQTEADGLRRAESLDAAYLARLASDSADAVPALMATLSQLKPEDRCMIAAGLVNHYDRQIKPQTEAGDWRSLNVARATAQRWLTPEWREDLDKIACPENVYFDSGL